MEFEPGKLFVARLSWESNETNLKEHFSKYGKVKECLIAVDKVTRVHRGFGFVTFTDPLAAEKALQEKHIILGREADVKPAVRRQEGTTQNKEVQQVQVDEEKLPTKKIFVGGLPHNLKTEELKNYFGKFGAITEAVIVEQNGRSRGFGFITFDSKEAVDDVTQEIYYELNDKLVEVRRAEPKKERKYKVTETYDCHNVGSDLCYYCFFCFSCSAPYGYEHRKRCLLYGQNSGGYYLAYPCGVPVPTRFWNEERL